MNDLEDYLDRLVNPPCVAGVAARTDDWVVVLRPTRCKWLAGLLLQLAFWVGQYGAGQVRKASDTCDNQPKQRRER